MKMLSDNASYSSNRFALLRILNKLLPLRLSSSLRLSLKASLATFRIPQLELVLVRLRFSLSLCACLSMDTRVTET